MRRSYTFNIFTRTKTGLFCCNIYPKYASIRSYTRTNETVYGVNCRLTLEVLILIPCERVGYRNQLVELGALPGRTQSLPCDIAVDVISYPYYRVFS
jgi:hypothetical protein